MYIIFIDIKAYIQWLELIEYFKYSVPFNLNDIKSTNFIQNQLTVFWFVLNS